MLQSRPIRSKRLPTDGHRVSIMSRHTLNDGTTPDPSIQPSMYDDWLPVLAPPLTLIGSYYRRGLAWKDFEVAYLEYLVASAEARFALDALAQRAMTDAVTVLCTEDTPHNCHRRPLLEQAHLWHPGLEINIR